MPNCRVYFRDSQGIEHGVYLDAANRYHAFGLAMKQMQNCSWSNPDYRNVEKMRVQLLDGPAKWRSVQVTREQFEAWLANDKAQDGCERVRSCLKMLLGRIPPDRDFVKGIKAR